MFGLKLGLNRAVSHHSPYENTHLVGGLEHFFHILGIVIATDELIFFRGVGIPPTSHFRAV